MAALVLVEAWDYDPMKRSFHVSPLPTFLHEEQNATNWACPERARFELSTESWSHDPFRDGTCGKLDVCMLSPLALPPPSSVRTHSLNQVWPDSWKARPEKKKKNRRIVFDFCLCPFEVWREEPRCTSCFVWDASVLLFLCLVLLFLSSWSFQLINWLIYLCRLMHNHPFTSRLESMEARKPLSLCVCISHCSAPQCKLRWKTLTS